jgi:putative Mg2+ transporter-C (MgtC) family protein
MKQERAMETNIFDPQFWMAVGTAALCGAVIGVERQFRGKPAGIRTSMMICLGTTVFVRLGGLASLGGGDPTRVMSQVITGVGFIGAGVMLAREGLVLGVTSAAVIWMLAAIGCAVGLERYTAAIALAVVTVILLTGVELLEGAIRSLRSKGSEGGDKADER